MSTDRNLLIGILALQNGFVTGDHLIAAMDAWVLEKQTPLEDILVRNGSLETKDLELLETLVNRHLAAHDNDPEQCLEAISSARLIYDQLSCVADPDVQASIAHFGNGHALDVRTLVIPTVGATTSAASRFRILRPHAKGGLGEVFVAQDEELGREVALKQIQEQFADQADSRGRFLLEAEITGGLEHPGVVPVYGLGSYADGRPYYAMRFIRGDSLKDAIDRFHKADKRTKRDPSTRTLELRKLLSRMIEVCNAIEYSHSRGVLHRDLKPANIMLGKYGETLVVDWGMAKVIGRRESLARTTPHVDEVSLRPTPDSGSAPTQLGMAVGTPQYMSPEQAAGKHDELGPASDVYSLGATLYCLLTGQSPLADKPCPDVRELLQRVQQGVVTPPRQLKSEIPKPLDAICRRAMALAPADRYPSARALADDLEHWLADEPISAQPEGLSDRLFRMARRHRALAITTTAAAILIAVVASAAAFLVDRQRSIATQLAQVNKELADSEVIARKDADQARIAAEAARAAAEESAAKEKLARKEAVKLADEKETALQAAQESAANEKKARDEAVKLAETNAALAESEKRNHQKADRLSQFLIGAMQAEDPARFTGVAFFAPKQDDQKFTVFEMLRAETTRAYRELQAEPLTQAAVLDSIGDVCRQLAQFKYAERLLNDALKIRRENPNTDPSDLATSYFHTAWYYHERGNFEKATELYFAALEIARELPNGQPLVAEIMQNLGWLYFYETEDTSHEKMEQCFAEAIRIRDLLLKEAPPERRKPVLRDAVFTKLGVAAAYAGKEQMFDAKRISNDANLRSEIIEYQGDEVLANALTSVIAAGDHIGFREFPQAIDDLKQSLSLLQQAGEDQTVMGALVAFDLGDCYRKLNKPEEAEKWYMASIAIIQRNKFFQIPEQAKRVATVGTLLYQRGKRAQADQLWTTYLSQQKFRFGVDHPFYKNAVTAHQDFVAAQSAR